MTAEPCDLHIELLDLLRQRRVHALPAGRIQRLHDVLILLAFLQVRQRLLQRLKRLLSFRDLPVVCGVVLLPQHVELGLRFVDGLDVALLVRLGLSLRRRSVRITRGSNRAL